MQDLLKIVLPIVLSSVVAGIGALIKTSLERRDARRSAHRQLELATVRTQFVKEWLEVSRSLGGDAEYVQAATDKALDELDQAYADAQHALEDGKSALEGSVTSGVVHQLRRFAMLVRRERIGSYVVAAVMYVFVVSMWVSALGPLDATDPDELTRTEWIVYAAVSTLVLRVLAGAIVGVVERRVKPRPTAPALAAPTAHSPDDVAAHLPRATA